MAVDNRSLDERLKSLRIDRSPGGSGNNKGAILGAFIIWGLWSISGMAIGSFVPADLQARAAALRLVAIGLLLSLTLVIRPRGLIGEDLTVSRHLGEDARG